MHHADEHSEIPARNKNLLSYAVAKYNGSAKKDVLSALIPTVNGCTHRLTAPQTAYAVASHCAEHYLNTHDIRVSLACRGNAEILSSSANTQYKNIRLNDANVFTQYTLFHNSYEVIPFHAKAI
jgi:hypothetical protein